MERAGKQVNIKKPKKVIVHEIENCFDGVSWPGVEGCLTDVCVHVLIYFFEKSFFCCFAVSQAFFASRRYLSIYFKMSKAKFPSLADFAHWAFQCQSKSSQIFNFVQ